MTTIHRLRQQYSIRREGIIHCCDAVFPHDPFIQWEVSDSGWALALGIAKPFPTPEQLEPVRRRAMKRLEDSIARAIFQ
jgi:hypothetical protein